MMQNINVFLFYSTIYTFLQFHFFKSQSFQHTKSHPTVCMVDLKIKIKPLYKKNIKRPRSEFGMSHAPPPHISISFLACLYYTETYWSELSAIEMIGTQCILSTYGKCTCTNTGPLVGWQEINTS